MRQIERLTAFKRLLKELLHVVYSVRSASLQTQSDLI